MFELIETTSEHLRKARQVQRLLATKHQRGRKVPDLLIAAAAEARSLSVLHYDPDFDRIAAVTGQACEWVVAAGSADSASSPQPGSAMTGLSRRRSRVRVPSLPSTKSVQIGAFSSPFVVITGTRTA